jgi:hypothetical protein
MFNFADPNSTYGSSDGSMGGAGVLDPVTLQSALQALPAIQQAQRRAQQLRGYQQGFQQMASDPQGTGNYAPRQQGGLYPTVQQWRPDYAKMGQQVSGALGNYMTNNAANTAEDAYNAPRNQQVLRALQGLGSGNAQGGGGLGNLWAGQGGGWTGQ